jgi:hypothetical protein
MKKMCPNYREPCNCGSYCKRLIGIVKQDKNVKKEK